MELYDKITKKIESISVIGLGYVGLPLAVAFAKKVNVIGFDINKNKIQKYLKGIDVTKEVGDDEISKSTVQFNFDEKVLRSCKFHIVAVPTPINLDKTPDLIPVIEASHTVGRNLVKGSIVVYESTVFPGVTEDICIPILEKESGFKCGVDFKVGYSPERINPGDKINRLETIVKVVSGMDENSLNEIASVYELIIEAGVHRASSIKVAEASKVIENAQRDINIAFMNELSVVFNRMDIDTKKVLEAAKTKWNFLDFTPGLVGGHCIGVDPYYFIYKAEQLGYHSQIILAGRRINDGMSKHIVENTLKKLIKMDKAIKGSRVAIMGVAFKGNCIDFRNSKVFDIIKDLQEYGVVCVVHDPLVDKEQLMDEIGIELSTEEELKGLDAIIFAVDHDIYKSYSLDEIKTQFEMVNPVLIDVKGLFKVKEAKERGYEYWSL